MHYFLDPSFDPLVGILNEVESRHALKSLRLKEGDEIEVGDGKGNYYSTQIKTVGKSEIILDVCKSDFFEIPSLQLTIAIAPTKNPSRFEWFLEKATELGVYEIIPIETTRTERPRLKLERAERIIHSATKQCQRKYLPKLHPFTRFKDILANQSELKLIAHCENDDRRVEFSEVIRTASAKSVLILIGPEGDFSPDEINLALEAGFNPVSLGRNRLRTETAGVFAAASVYQLF